MGTLSDRCVIRADFADFRRVKGRKVMQLYMEIPLEEAENALRVLGHPAVGESKWVAIALLKPEAAGQESAANGSTKDPKPFSTLPLSQQAAIRTDDTKFREFLETVMPIHDQESYADAVRAYCGVDSRSEIRPGTPAAVSWLALEARYQAYLTDRKFADIRR